MKTKINSGYVYALTCVLLWSFVPVVSRFGQSNLDNFQFLFWSNCLSFLVVGLCMLVRKGLAPLKEFSGKRIVYILFLGALGCAVYYLCLYYGYAKGNSIEVLIMQYSWPLQIIVLSVFILGERLPLKSWLAIGIGFLGIVIVLTKGKIADIQFSNLTISFIVLAGAFCFASFSVLSKKLRAEPYTTTTLLFIGGTIISTISLMLFSSFQLPSRAELPSVIINGALINGVSYILWLVALEKIPASISAVLVFLSPALSAIWIVVFFREVFYPAYVIGLVLVLASGYFCIKCSRTSLPASS